MISDLFQKIKPDHSPPVYDAAQIAEVDVQPGLPTPGPWSRRLPRFNGGRPWSINDVPPQVPCPFDIMAIERCRARGFDARQLLAPRGENDPGKKRKKSKGKGGRRGPNLSLEAARIVERALGANLSAIERQTKYLIKKRRALQDRFNRLPTGSPLFGLYPPSSKIPRKRNRKTNFSSSPPDPDAMAGPLFQQPPLPPFPVFSTGRPLATAAVSSPAEGPSDPPPLSATPAKPADAEPADEVGDFRDPEDGMSIEDGDEFAEERLREADGAPDPVPSQPEDWDREIRVHEKMLRPRGRGKGKRRQ